MQFSPTQLRPIERTLLSTTSYTSTLLSSSRTAYVGKLEKHLSDYRAGRGDLGTGVPNEILRQTFASSEFYAKSDPRTAATLSGYLSGFTYSQRARFINGVESGTSTVTLINRAQEDGAKLEEQLRELHAKLDTVA